MTKEEAIAKCKTEWWNTASAEEICRFQLYERRLCMPFALFQQAVEKVLKRPVWTHEFADQHALIAEFEKRIAAPSFEDIVNKLADMVDDSPIMVVSTKR